MVKMIYFLRGQKFAASEKVDKKIVKSEIPFFIKLSFALNLNKIGEGRFQLFLLIVILK